MQNISKRKLRHLLHSSPVAALIAEGAKWRLEHLEEHPGRYLSLRQAAECLICSVQPIRDWIRKGLIRADGPRGQIPKTELVALVRRFEELRLHESYDPASLAKRFHSRRRPKRKPFQKLREADFDWPRDRKTLSPGDLARLTGCHPSYILLAVKKKYLRGKRPTPCRWAIRQSDWNRFLQREYPEFG